MKGYHEGKHGCDERKRDCTSGFPGILGRLLVLRETCCRLQWVSLCMCALVLVPFLYV